MLIHGGRLAYYCKCKNFEADCGNKDHGRCVMTRVPTAKFRAADGIDRGGRPVGFMATWLSLSYVRTKEEHNNPEFIKRMCESSAVRMVQRAAVISTEAGAKVASYERKRVGEEPEEPADLRGLLGD